MTENGSDQPKRLKCYQYGGHFRALYDLYEKGELKWFLFSSVILALTFGVFGFTSMSNVKKAKAETYRTSKFLTKGTTSVDGATPTSGCPDNFKVYMCGAYTGDKTSEIYRSTIIDWTYYKITVEVKNVSNHIAFSLTRNG